MFLSISIYVKLNFAGILSIINKNLGAPMQIKLLAFDLDGTTLNEKKQVSAKNICALKAAAQKGVLLVPATGRVRSFIPGEILRISAVRYLITSNGASVYDRAEDQEVYSNLIPNEKTWEIQQVLERYDIYIDYYTQGCAITKAGNPEKAAAYFGFPPDKMTFTTKKYTFIDSYAQMILETGICPEKVNLPYVKDTIYDKLQAELEALGGLKITSSLKNNMELNSEGANKGDGLAALAGLLQITPDEIMAIGDNSNDIEMLQYAGCSVSMGNGTEAARLAAKYETGLYDKDGLAEAINQFILTE